MATRSGRIRNGWQWVAALGVVLAGACGGSEDFGAWEQRFYWGAHVAPAEPNGYGAAVKQLEGAAGTTMAAGRVYHRWEDEFPADAANMLKRSKRLMVLSIKPIRADGERIPWADIAAAPIGSPLHAEMVDWARRLRRYGRPVYVSFHHEPETGDDQASGRRRDYLAAFARFADVVRAEGGPHVRTMWIMTDRSFTLAPDERQHAERWYPGDAAVDAIGVDAFNWFTCRGRDEQWTSISALVGPALTFANARAKPLWIAELGSISDPAAPERRAEWLAELPTLLARPEAAAIRGVLYFDDLHGAEFPDCDWRLDGSIPAATEFGRLATVPAEPATASPVTPPTTD